MALLGSGSSSTTRDDFDLPTPFVAPAGEREAAIAGIFAEIFSVGSVGANDDFFDLGGDSLLAESLCLLIAERSGCDFQLSALMEHGTPRKIAALLEGHGRKTTEHAPSAARHVRPPIFVVHGRNGFTLLPPDFRRALAPDQRLQVFELPGIRGGHSYDAIEDIAAVYIGEIMDTHPEGPVLLAGFCMGGLVALEIASQLSAKRRPIRQLVLLDPTLPKPTRSSKHNKGSEWPPRATLPETLWMRLRHPLGLPPERRTPRQRRAFANDEAEFLRRLEEKTKEGRVNYPGLQLSTRAQARLQASYRQYRPPPFHGPAAILSSAARDATFRDDGHLWSELLPGRKVYRIADTHGEITGPASAKAMQSIFDAAIAEDQTLAMGDER
jgi:thioesterase domain-containing protein